MKPALAALLALLPASAGQGAEMGGVVENDSVAWRWTQTGRQIQVAGFDAKFNGSRLPLEGDCFRLVLDHGRIAKSSDFVLTAEPKLETVEPIPTSPRLADHCGGRQLVAILAAPEFGLTAEWRVMVRDGSHYARQELTLRATEGDVFIDEINLFEQRILGSRTVGEVDGSPVVTSEYFFGYEHPMARNTVDSNGVVRCVFPRHALLKKGETLTQGCVLGATVKGQMRRGFLDYIERERPRAVEPFLHYNSWYDIAWDGRKYNEAEALNDIDQFGRELTVERHTQMQSFLFDDGWDDNRTLWNFHSGFPHGFAPLTAEAAKYRAGIGVWLSPFGGYGEARAERLACGAREGFETNASGFSLSGSNYFRRFSDICLEMVRKYDVNQFKFDGLSAGARAGEEGLTRDGDAMLGLIAKLRTAKPAIFINQTTGTWPSPFWLLYVDSTWRGGDDHSFAGKGSFCQQWMTYRDAQTYRNVVKRGPLYPLNSLMLHGLIYATNADRLKTMSDADFAAQTRAYFGNGTQLQELYITPGLLNRRNWDDLANAAKWARANADVLADSHWVGGDPAAGEVYGWASWAPRKAILVLRNPDDQPARFDADIGKSMELPQGADSEFQARRQWVQAANEPSITLKSGVAHTFALQPFEVSVWELTP